MNRGDPESRVACRGTRASGTAARFRRWYKHRNNHRHVIATIDTQARELDKAVERVIRGDRHPAPLRSVATIYGDLLSIEFASSHNSTFIFREANTNHLSRSHKRYEVNGVSPLRTSCRRQARRINHPRASSFVDIFELAEARNSRAIIFRRTHASGPRRIITRTTESTS